MTIKEVKEKIALMLYAYDKTETYLYPDLIDDLRRLYFELKEQ